MAIHESFLHEIWGEWCYLVAISKSFVGENPFATNLRKFSPTKVSHYIDLYPGLTATYTNILKCTYVMLKVNSEYQHGSDLLSFNT